MLHSLELDQRALPALPVVGVNKKGEGNYARATQDPGGFRAADQGFDTATKSALARFKTAASLAPTFSAALTMEGPAAANPSRAQRERRLRAPRATPLRTASGAPVLSAPRRRQLPGGTDARDGQRHR